jgi:hypothetical protein
MTSRREPGRIASAHVPQELLAPLIVLVVEDARENVQVLPARTDSKQLPLVSSHRSRTPAASRCARA